MYNKMLKKYLEFYSMKKISIVVPIYKKEAIIFKCITKKLLILKKICEKVNLDYELIAVIDGRFDNSAAELSRIKDKILKFSNINTIEVRVSQFILE